MLRRGKLYGSGGKQISKRAATRRSTKIALPRAENFHPNWTEIEKYFREYPNSCACNERKRRRVVSSARNLSILQNITRKWNLCWNVNICTLKVSAEIKMLVRNGQTCKNTHISSSGHLKTLLHPKRATEVVEVWKHRSAILAASSPGRKSGKSETKPASNTKTKRSKINCSDTTSETKTNHPNCREKFAVLLYLEFTILKKNI